VLDGVQQTERFLAELEQRPASRRHVVHLLFTDTGHFTAAIGQRARYKAAYDAVLTRVAATLQSLAVLFVPDDLQGIVPEGPRLPRLRDLTCAHCARPAARQGAGAPARPSLRRLHLYNTDRVQTDELLAQAPALTHLRASRLRGGPDLVSQLDRLLRARSALRLVVVQVAKEAVRDEFGHRLGSHTYDLLTRHMALKRELVGQSDCPGLAEVVLLPPQYQDYHEGTGMWDWKRIVDGGDGCWEDVERKRPFSCHVEVSR
jgi:hypothetical protein